MSKRSMTQADFAAFDIEPLETKGIQKNSAKKSFNEDKNISNFNFELEMQREAEKISGRYDLQTDHNQLIKQLQSIGIDVFEYTDMTHQDRHQNIKVRDVIQIYRIFDNLRDSKEDKFDEIKLYKLQKFPFFDQSDYDAVAFEVKRNYEKKQSRGGPKQSFVECRVEGPRHSIGTKGGSGNCLYCTGVDSETVYLNDNNLADKPVRGGRNYLTSKDTDSPLM